MANVSNTVEFGCTCGKKIRARVDQGGKTFKCPDCGESVRVPSVKLSEAVNPSTSNPDFVADRAVPATFTQLLSYLAACWAFVGLIALVTCLVSKILAAVVFFAATFFLGQQFWLMLIARQKVLSAKNIPLLWNRIRLIAWDPIEGVLILRNKAVAFCDDNLHDAAGGVRLLYSILGEELALRAPLEVQTLSFRDENVLTREYLTVTIRGTMKWRITDLRKFYLLVSRELRSTTNQNDRESISASTRADVSSDGNAEAAIRQLLRAAISWMQVLVEEETRNVVSRARTGLLVADKLSQEIFPQRPGQTNVHDGPDHAGAGWAGGAADELAGAIHQTIANRLQTYGIGVEDVSLQEIKLPEEVMRECIEAAKAFYLPTIAKRKASFTRENLQAQADVIGREALATKEVVGAAPAFSLPDFLNQYLTKRTFAPANGIGVSPDASALLTTAALGAASSGLLEKGNTPADSQGSAARGDR